MSDDDPKLTLRQLGWSSFFSQQLTPEEHAALTPGRVFAVQRSGVTVAVEGGASELALSGRWYQLEPEERPTIGDWVLLDSAGAAIARLLERKSLLKRKAVGREREIQTMAANVDTMFLVSSCNEEFNPSRVERYLALALDAGVEPVVVLTKADLVAEPEQYASGLRELMRGLVVEVVDARDESTLRGVRAWCQPGQTVALLGSSGVGKSTLVNSLSGRRVQLTQAAREDDGKGRHTTTHRSLHLLPDGGLLVDNPGMRELSLADVDVSAGTLFEDVDALAAGCRFRDCQHEAEPGCAVRRAIESGELDPRRLQSYRKLAREEAHFAESVAERHARSRAFGRRVRQLKDDQDKSER